MNLNPYLKAVIAAAVAGLGSAYAAVVASPSHSIDLGSGIAIALAAVTALGGVYATANTDAPAQIPDPLAGPKHAAPVGQAATDQMLPPLPASAGLIAPAPRPEATPVVTDT